MSQYFQGDLNPPHERLASLLTSKKGKRVLVITFFLGMIGQIVSASVPGGWMLDRLLRKIEKHLLGIDSMEIIRLASFIMVLHRPGTVSYEKRLHLFKIAQQRYALEKRTTRLALWRIDDNSCFFACAIQRRATSKFMCP
jgi:hypothetical protein